MEKSKIVFILSVLIWASAPIAAWAAIDSTDSKFLYSNYSKKVSMDFKEAALSDVLKIFSQQSGMNFIASNDLSGKRVTLFFENIPVEEALEKILMANGLTYETQPGSDIFVVKALPTAEESLITKIYSLKYASVSSAKINKTIKISKPGGGSDSGSGESSSGSSEGGGSSKEGASAGIQASIKNVLSSYGKISEDARTNSLVITDIESQFPVIENMIKRLDVPIPQIMIQVEMLDVSKGTADLMGVKYSDTLFQLTGAKRQVLFPWDQKLLSDKGYSFATPEYTAGLIDTSTMTAVVQFLETQSDTRNLARPRLLTLNNETAEIKISTDEAIGISSNTTSSQGTASSAIEAERVETGVFLLVTPQANLSTGEITMAIAPRVIQARTGGTFGGQTFKDPEERGSQQLMKVKDGDTIIIGGLMRKESTETITKLPILGDIPLLGRAFRHKNRTDAERELLIFITPSIVRGSSHKSKLNSNQKQDQSFNREQDMPKARLKQVNKELSSIEQQRF